MNKFISLLFFVLASTLVLNCKKYIVSGDSMTPALNNGDTVIVTSDRNYKTNDIIVIDVEDNLFMKRIAGIEGDIINKNNEGIIVNEKQYKTLYSYDLFYPIILGHNEYFVFGDNLDYSMDSRVFGVINKGQIIGKVIYIWHTK